MAKCWTGVEVRCKECRGETERLEDSYGGLMRGGDYERFQCKDCQLITYVELPD